MSDRSKVPWIDAVLNPYVGCYGRDTICRQCWAMGIASRLGGHVDEATARGGAWSGRVVPTAVDLAHTVSRWRKPRVISVGPLTDVFHLSAPVARRRQLFQTIFDARNSGHVFVIMTRQTETAAVYLQSLRSAAESTGISGLGDVHPGLSFQHLWLGFGLGSEVMSSRARVRHIRIIRDIPRFLIMSAHDTDLTDYHLRVSGASWVLLEGVSNTTTPSPRVNPEWARRAIAIARNREIPVYFSGWGSWVPENQVPPGVDLSGVESCSGYYKLGRKLSGDFIDGVQYHELPPQFLINKRTPKPSGATDVHEPQESQQGQTSR